MSECSRLDLCALLCLVHGHSLVTSSSSAVFKCHQFAGNAHTSSGPDSALSCRRINSAPDGHHTPHRHPRLETQGPLPRRRLALPAQSPLPLPTSVLQQICWLCLPTSPPQASSTSTFQLVLCSPFGPAYPSPLPRQQEMTLPGKASTSLCPDNSDRCRAALSPGPHPLPLTVPHLLGEAPTPLFCCNSSTSPQPQPAQQFLPSPVGAPPDITAQHPQIARDETLRDKDAS